MHRELNIRPARFHPDFPNHSNGGVTHDLIFAVSKRLGRSDGDRVTGMYAHGVKILNRTNDDDVVAQIAHDLKFVLFPAENGLFDQGLVHRREIQTAGKNIQQFFAVVSDASTASAQREAWPHNDRKPDFACEFKTVFQIVDQG